jgi:hypothetical protein
VSGEPELRGSIEQWLDRKLRAVEADLDARLKKHVHAMAFAEGAAVFALVDGLRARGVTRFEGLSLKLELGEAPSTAPPPGQPHANGTALVDAGGGVMVDEDLFAHEGEQ